MGMAKDAMLEEFRKESIALEFLVEAGIFERCPIHEDYTYDVGSLEDAFEIAEGKNRNGEIHEEFDSYEEFIRFIEIAFINNSSIDGSCTLCGKYCVDD